MKIDCKILEAALIYELVQHGIDSNDAEWIARSFVTADLSGYPEQGSIRLLQLIDGLNNKTIHPHPSFTVLKDNLACLVIDGQQSIGQLIARDAVKFSIQRAKQFGVGVCGVINAGHIGCLSFYTKMAACHECISIAMTTSSPIVSLVGGKHRIFGTNPLSYAIPSKTDPIVADFSTSKVSRGKVLEKKKRGESIPLNWCVDKEGKPTTNPSAIENGGSLLPFDDGAKASMLSLLIGMLAGPLIGGVNSPDVRGTRYMNLPPNKGDFFITFHIPHFTKMTDFIEKAEELKKLIQECDSDFHIPGSQSRANEEENQCLGVEIDERVLTIISHHLQGCHYERLSSCN